MRGAKALSAGVSSEVILRKLRLRSGQDDFFLQSLRSCRRQPEEFTDDPLRCRDIDRGGRIGIAIGASPSASS